MQIDTLVKLFFSLDGRISRLTWWVANIPLFAISLLTSYLLIPGYFDLSSEAVADPAWGDSIVNALIILPTTVLSAKRFADINFPAWPAYLLAVVTMTIIFAPFAGYLHDPNRFTAVEDAFMLGALAIMLLTIAANGFVKGYAGPNPYGPDPLDRGKPEAA